MTGSIYCRQRRKFSLSSFFEIEFEKAEAKEDAIQFVTIDDQLSSTYHHRVSRLRELRENGEIKYHLLTLFC